jgi:hypothetical protein
MKNTPHPNLPDEMKIEEMLSHFKPQPTLRFYNKMSTAPWHRSITPDTSTYLPNRKHTRRLIWGLIALLFMIGVLGITLIPSVRVIARQIIYSFISAPSNQIEVQVTLTSPGDLYNFSDPANFQLSIKYVQQQAGFEIKEISSLPGSLSFIGARFDPNYKTATLLYQGNDYKVFLTQRPLGNSLDVFSIGESALIKLVNIGDFQGEYVDGGWKVISTQPASENQTPTSSVNINAIWDNELPQSTLRWQLNGIVYELRSVGDGRPPQSELIIMANELK